jgi:hypothetical protein
MRNFDFSPLTRSTVGFDRVFDLLDSAFTAAQVDEGYPPFNIVKTGIPRTGSSSRSQASVQATCRSWRRKTC